MGNCSLFLLSVSLRLQQTFPNRDSYNEQGSVGGGAGDESPKSISSFVQDKDFILDCLCWHNEYRARHSAQALTVSPEVSTLLFSIFLTYSPNLCHTLFISTVIINVVQSKHKNKNLYTEKQYTHAQLPIKTNRHHKNENEIYSKLCGMRKPFGIWCYFIFSF